MKPWCDRPLCARQFTHSHPEGPQTASGDDLSASGAVEVVMEPRNGETAPERSEPPSIPDEAWEPNGAIDLRGYAIVARETFDPLRERTPGTEVTGGASPEVEAGDGPDLTETRRVWEALADELAAAEAEVTVLRATRVKILETLRDQGLSLGQIAEVTGLTRQRVGQLLK